MPSDRMPGRHCCRQAWVCLPVCITRSGLSSHQDLLPGVSSTEPGLPWESRKTLQSSVFSLLQFTAALLSSTVERSEARWTLTIIWLHMWRPKGPTRHPFGWFFTHFMFEMCRLFLEAQKCTFVCLKPSTSLMGVFLFLCGRIMES